MVSVGVGIERGLPEAFAQRALGYTREQTADVQAQKKHTKTAGAL